MPNFEGLSNQQLQQKRLSQAFLPNGDVALDMEDDNHSEDELDAIEQQRKRGNGEKETRKSPDNISMHSVSTTNSEMILLPNTPDNQRRRPLSHHFDNSPHPVIDARGYVRKPNNGQRSRSPSPNNGRHQPQTDLSMANLRKFDNIGGAQLLPGEPARGRARSLMDLRVIALTGEAQKHGEHPTGGLYKSKSIENILTGQVHRLAPHPNSSGSSTSSASGRKQPKGIYARQREREMEDSSF